MRILIIDDEPAMHDSYRQCFAPASGGTLDAMAAELFGDDDTPAPADDAPEFALTHAMQGLDGVAEVEKARVAGDPFAVAFIDIRMPPGIDGRETAKRIRALDPDINLVIVTGYSDFSPIEIAKVAGPADKIFYIAKPFEVDEIVQTATALTKRWQIDLELAAARAQLAAQVVTLEDQSRELAANESKALHMATHDSLTEAPNRLAFLRALTERSRGKERFATAMLDLDRFKLVNDTLGHLAGDEMIRSVYQLLSAAVPEGGMVARLGGDEFGILFDTPGEEAAVMACELMLRRMSVTLTLVGHSVQANASIGVVVTEAEPVRDPVDVMRRADLALNEAKRAGRGVVRAYDESMDDSIKFRRRIEGGLGQAIARGELKLVYQPIVGGEALDIVGFEGLLRWASPEYGPISPAMFIPIAEESNLIHDLGDFVIETALAELHNWPGQYVSINFSPRQFRRHNFVAHLVECVQRAGVEPARVQIEITETAIFDDADRAAETLYRLRQMGFRIALDDFGTGYSSLYNIRKFALDCLKIDRSFIDGMGRERESAAIVHSIIHLGRALGLGVIAEGVETEAQLQALRLAGASHMQGYYFARPVDAQVARDMAARGSIEGKDDPGDGPALLQGTGTHG
ncbi:MULTISPECIES: putative bifunctional diguanylate cyclase/phosphodiesterase [Sphingomonas]|uniref:putative bifunctional diguanylate cyclase/phosphodiesterase n=1 Tax=Sphingomonas TaxID=13687 RepID=UPI00082E8C50|nr:EAL domain-containing protein [Sphingomonas sp. CCH10-B3]